MQPKKNFKNHLDHLEVNGITRIERPTERSEIEEMTGPIVDSYCTHVCSTCRESL
ncbi:hypothetical protein BDN72DRAFT_739039, partial [Pluteus cervinus]